MVLLLAVDAFQFSMFGKDRFIAHLQCIIVIKTKINDRLYVRRCLLLTTGDLTA